MSTPSVTRAIRESEVRQKVGLSHTSIWRLVKDGDFPRPFRIGKRAVAWRESDIDSWIQSKQSTAA